MQIDWATVFNLVFRFRVSNKCYFSFASEFLKMSNKRVLLNVDILEKPFRLNLSYNLDKENLHESRIFIVLEGFSRESQNSKQCD